MADLLDSFDDLSGRPRIRRSSYRFPDNNSHPLSSFSQRGIAPRIPSEWDAVAAERDYADAQAETQHLAQRRDLRAGLYEAEQRNRILEHSNAAFDMLKSADPNDPSFERIALDINTNHALAFQDPAFKQAFGFANGIFNNTVKVARDDARADANHQRQLERTDHSHQLQLERADMANREKDLRDLNKDAANEYFTKVEEMEAAGTPLSKIEHRRLLSGYARLAEQGKLYRDMTGAGLSLEEMKDLWGVDGLMDMEKGRDLLSQKKAQPKLDVAAQAKAALGAIKDFDPSTKEYGTQVRQVLLQYPQALRDPAFQGILKQNQPVYESTLKDARDQKRADNSSRAQADRQDRATVEANLRKLSPQAAEKYFAEVAQMGGELTPFEHRRLLNKYQMVAETDVYDAQLAALGVPWSARRKGDMAREDIFDPNTGFINPQKAQAMLREVGVTKEKVAWAQNIRKQVEGKNPVTDADWFRDNAENISNADRIVAGALRGRIDFKEDPAWAAVAGPTRELERLNQQVKAEPDPKKREAIFNQMRPLVAQRDEAAKAHPGFNLSLTPEEGETKAQMLNRLEDNARMLLRWPIGAPITVNGKPVKGGWTEADRETQVALLARIDGGGARPTPKALSSEEPRAQVDDYYNRSVAEDAAPAPTAAVPQVSPQQRRDEEIKAAALDRLKIPADPETAARLEAELAQVPKTGFWAALEEHGGDPGTGSKAQEAVWSMFARNAKQVHAEDRFNKLRDLYSAELEVFDPIPKLSVFEQLKQGATRDPKAPMVPRKLPPEKEAAYENAFLEVYADMDPDAEPGTAKERANRLRNRDLGLALRKARQEQLTAELKK